MDNSKKSFFGYMNFNRTVLEEHKEPPWEPQWKKPEKMPPGEYRCSKNHDPYAFTFQNMSESPFYSDMEGNSWHSE